MERSEREALSRRLFEVMKQADQQGNLLAWQTAQRQLYEIYERQALGFGWQVIRRNGRLDRADVLQECRVALIEAMRIWEPERGGFVVPLLFRLRKRLQRFLRDEGYLQSRKSSVHQDKEEQETFQLVSYDDFLSEEDWLRHGESDRHSIAARLQEIAVGQAVSRLPAQEQEAVRLYYGLTDGRERTLREVGDLTHCSYVTARRRIQDALPKLAEMLGA